MFLKNRPFQYGRRPQIYLPTPKSPKTFKFPWRSIKTIFLLAVFFGLIYLFLFSPLFVIKNVKVDGASNQEAIKLCGEAKGKNLWRFNKKILKDELLGFAEIGDVKISRFPPKTLKVKIGEKAEGIIWQTGGKSYLLDIDGFIIKEVLEETDLPRVLDQKAAPVSINSQVVTPSFVGFAKELYSQFGQKTALQLTEVSISESIFELTAKTNTIYLKLDPQGDLQVQLDYFVKTYQEKKDEIKEYVDLTTWDKEIVVYK